MRRTVVVPALEEEEHIERSLKSLRDQSISPDELIVVDSYSSDRTQKLASRYADQVLQAPNSKLSAKNIGADASAGEVVLFADADRVYPRDWVSNISRHFEDPEVVGVSGPVGFDHTDVPFWGPLEGGLRKVTFAFAPMLSGGYWMDGGNSGVRRSVFLDSGGHRRVNEPTNISHVWFEEELRFPKRLGQYGRVLTDPDAMCAHEPRRIRAFFEPGEGDRHTQEVRGGRRF